MEPGRAFDKMWIISLRRDGYQGQPRSQPLGTLPQQVLLMQGVDIRPLDASRKQSGTKNFCLRLIALATCSVWQSSSESTTSSTCNVCTRCVS